MRTQTATLCARLLLSGICVHDKRQGDLRSRPCPWCHLSTNYTRPGMLTQLREPCWESAQGGRTSTRYLLHKTRRFPGQTTATLHADLRVGGGCIYGGGPPSGSGSYTGGCVTDCQSSTKQATFQSALHQECSAESPGPSWGDGATPPRSHRYPMAIRLPLVRH